MMFRSLREFWSDNRGAPIIEASVILPFLILLGLGAVEFGYVLYQYQIVSTSLKSAARYYVRLSFAGETACNTNTLVCDLVSVDIEEIKNFAVYDQSTGEARVAGWTPEDIEFSETIPEVVGDIINIRTDFSPNGLGFTRLLGLSSSFRIIVSHEEICVP